MNANAPNRRAASHGRVEHARQVLVKAEEAYLREHNWQRTLISKDWFWQLEVGGVRLVLPRSHAVTFQHNLESLPPAAPPARAP